MMQLLWRFFWREKELKRQTVHLIFGLCYALAYIGGYLEIWMSYAFLGFTILVALFLKKRRRWIDRIVLLLERENHLFDLPLRGAISFVLGASLTITFFDHIPAFCGIVVLSVVDSVGTLYGKYVGLVKIPWDKERHLEGPIIGGFLAALMCVSVLPFWLALLASYVGALVDSIRWKIGRFEIDDNILIPLISAGVVQGLI